MDRYQLHVIQSVDDPWCRLIADDPVRPHIALDSRINQHGRMFVLLESDQPAAAICCAYRDTMPSSEIHLLAQLPHSEGSALYAVFYTVWSYRPGAGRAIISQTRQWIQQNGPTSIRHYVTLSPKTEMARRFHLSNGAHEGRVNEDSINYCYP